MDPVEGDPECLVNLVTIVDLVALVDPVEGDPVEGDPVEGDPECLVNLVTIVDLVALVVLILILLHKALKFSWRNY